jgi:AcrR family transcriptional regulator
VPNPDLERKIREKTLDLLMVKEPEEIGMRDIATACGVTATTIYYYFSDKENLFDAVKVDCIATLDSIIEKRVASVESTAGKIRESMAAFRDWSLANPRVALLVMGKLKPNLELGPDTLPRYYRSSNLAKELLDQAVAEGLLKCEDTLLYSSLCIAGLWGAIESVLLNRTNPEYWNNGKYFTDRMIDLVLPAGIGQGVTI